MRAWTIRLPFGLLLLTAALLIAAVLATAHGLHSWRTADIPFDLLIDDLLIDGEDVGTSLQQQMAWSGLGGAALLCLGALLLLGLAVALPLLLMGLLALLVLGAVALLVGLLIGLLGAPLLALGLVLALLLAPLVGLAVLLRWLLR